LSFRKEDTVLNHRVWLAILAAFLSAAASAQTASHFDVAGSVSYGGSQVTGASGTSTTQVNGYGWQASGISHFNRWLSLTSEFNNSSASANSISLIGYTGPGTLKHYSVLAGPRIYLPFGRFSPFVEGLAGYDHADTSLTSNGAAVTGNETQIAYAFGGGAQVGLTHRVGLNFEASYFGSEHTLAFTGWQPSHFQISAGIVIRLFGSRAQPQIAKERPLPPPSAPAGTPAESATVTATSEPTQPAAVQQASVQPAPVVQTRVAHAEAPIISTEVVAQPIDRVKPPTLQHAVAAAAAVTPTPAPKPERVSTMAVISNPPAKQTPTIQPTPQPVPTRTQPVAAAQPRPLPQVAQSQPETSQPISLGEYARRLREKKQQQQSASIHLEN
jgi:opacity protein-like surface antigen